MQRARLDLLLAGLSTPLHAFLEKLHLSFGMLKAASKTPGLLSQPKAEADIKASTASYVVILVLLISKAFCFEEGDVEKLNPIPGRTAYTSQPTAKTQ